MKILLTTILIIVSLISFSQTSNELFKKAQAKFNQGDYKEAIELYTKAYEADPENLNAILQRGFAYGLIEDYTSAISDYNKFIEKNDNQVWAYISRGSAYNKTKQYDKAIKDFNKVIQLDPKNTEAYNNRGWAKKFKGDKKGACADWKKSKKYGNKEAKIILKNNKC